MGHHENRLIYKQEYHKAVLGPLLFLIYKNDLPSGLKSICKLFADDKSLFLKMKDLDR